MASTIFQKDSKINTLNLTNIQDFSLVEHIHYKNASLKNYIPLLLDLGNSCASFHALKADMLIRHLLDNLVAENYEAIAASSKLTVVKQTTRIALYRCLSMAKEWMEENFKEALNTQQLADVAMLNSEHFIRLFQKAFNITPHQYLIKLRLDYAKKILIETNIPVGSICHQIGFESLSSFSGLFKTKVGLSPIAFRKKHANP